MPISEKIEKKIQELPSSVDEKNLLLSILEIEDKGSYRYQDEYMKVIDEYIKNHAEGDAAL